MGEYFVEGLGVEGGWTGHYGEDEVDWEADCGGLGGVGETVGVYEEMFSLGYFEGGGDVV